ncbi:MAG: VWA domain-containing protein [Nitrospinae bacterium]|nr:VWA domain-containing protein [Nitrospinota bacterium]
MILTSFKRTLISTFFFVISLLVSLPVSAKEGNLLIVFDASGSMWGKIGGIIKMELATVSLNSALQNIKGEPNVGLIAFGHNRQKDCSDIEFISPLKKLDKNFLIQKVKGLVPRGKTPLTSAIRMSLAEIQAKGEEATVLIISDGKDTCHEDPCLIAKQLKSESRVNFKIDVIGMVSRSNGGVNSKSDSEESYDQLKCITEVTGGKFYSVNNAGEFSLALTESMGGETTVNKEQVIDDMEEYKFSTDVLDDEYRIVNLTSEKKTSKKILPGMNVLSAGFIDKGIPQIGTVVQGNTERKNLYIHDRVTVKLTKKAKLGERLILYEIAKEDVEDPITGNELGNLYEVNAVIEITKPYKDNYYFAKMIELFDVALVGSPIMEYKEYETPTKFPFLKKPHRGMSNAVIVASHQKHIFSGKGDFVHINKGSADKLFLGDDFEIYPGGNSSVKIDASETIIGTAWKSISENNEDQITPEQQGVLTIVGMREHTAVGLITKCEKKIITVGDTIKLIND